MNVAVSERCIYCPGNKTITQLKAEGKQIHYDTKPLIQLEITGNELYCGAEIPKLSLIPICDFTDKTTKTCPRAQYQQGGIAVGELIRALAERKK